MQFLETLMIKQAKTLNELMQRMPSTIQKLEEFELFNSAYSYHTKES